MTVGPLAFRGAFRGAIHTAFHAALPVALHRRRCPAGALLLLVTCLALGGCNRFLREMYDQPKLTSLKTSPLFPDGMASRPPPPGSVAHSLGVAATTSSGRRGTEAVAALDAADAAAALPASPSAALIARGHERYDIYCAPCHSIVGDGDGPVVRRGYPAPPSYRIERLMRAPDRHFFDVITHGYGIMYSYAGRVDAPDRWGDRRLRAATAEAGAGTDGCCFGRRAGEAVMAQQQIQPQPRRHRQRQQRHSTQRRWLSLGHPLAPWLGVLLILAALPGYWVAPRTLFACWLAACWFALGIVLGSLSLLWVHRLTGGAWGQVLRPHILAIAERMPRVLLAFLPLGFGLPLLYASFASQAPSTAAIAVDRMFLDAWHSPLLFLLRWLVYAAVWWWLARRSRGPLAAGAAASSLLLHLAVTSLAAIDALVALVPGWSSSGFALAALVGMTYGGGAWAIAAACRTLRLAGAQPATAGVPVSRDLGNLLLMAVLLWAYLYFMQFLIIWSVNLPREIAWYVPRLQTGWWFGGLALVLLHLTLPFALLLFRAVKDTPRRLEAVAAGMVGIHAFDVLWQTLPSVAPHDWLGWWLAPLVMAGVLLLCFGGSIAHRAVAQPSGLADVRA